MIQFEAPQALGTLAINLHFADLNGDLAPDIVSTDYASLSVSSNVGDGTFSEPLRFPVTTMFAPAVTVGDLDADVDLDLVLLTGIGGTVEVWLNPGNGEFGLPMLFDAGAAGAPALADTNGDGILDLIVVQNGQISVLRGDGDGGLEEPEVFEGMEDLSSYATGDVDGDGDIDILLRAL